jgi:ferredoxin
MSIAIYYFSGTGNSICVAREISGKLPDSKLIPMVSELQKEEIPIPMRMFLDKAVIGSRYLFAVCTRGGTATEGFEYINSLMKKQRKRLNATISVTMPCNHPLGKENMTSEANLRKLADLETAMKKKLDVFIESIKEEKEHHEPDTDADYKLPKWIKLFYLSKTFNYESHRFMYQNVIRFYSDLKCTGCGICEKVCLSRKVILRDGKPYWLENKKCFGCFACINYCPQKAIQIKSRFPIASYTTENGRYHHPEIDADRISAQKGDRSISE